MKPGLAVGNIDGHVADLSQEINGGFHLAWEIKNRRTVGFGNKTINFQLQFEILVKHSVTFPTVDSMGSRLVF